MNLYGPPDMSVEPRHYPQLDSSNLALRYSGIQRYAIRQSPTLDDFPVEGIEGHETKLDCLERNDGAGLNEHFVRSRWSVDYLFGKRRAV